MSRFWIIWLSVLLLFPIPTPASADTTCSSESECIALLAIFKTDIQVLRSEMSTANANEKTAQAAAALCKVMYSQRSEAYNKCSNSATDAQLMAAEAAEKKSAELQEAVDRQAEIQAQLFRINGANSALEQNKAAADKAAALNKEINETFIVLTNNLNKYKIDISQLFRDYPAYFNQTPELRSSLQRAIDYKIPKAASQPGIDAMRELIGGGSGSALASDFLIAQAGITKYVALENIKAKTAKKITITCHKGKLTKKVTAVSPKCPSGYKKK